MNVDASWLDFKLGLRMLVKHPVLTVIGAVATTFAIGAGALYFEVVNDFSNPRLPLPDGARVVAIQNEDLEAAARERRSLHDFLVWRRELKSVEDLSVFTVYSRNLGRADEPPLPVEVVEISASAFRVARVPAVMGRPLVEADEQPGAPPVVVIGERLWEKRFSRDPAIVGQSVELGSSWRTVVGVMPDAFALPVNQSLWIPFRSEPPVFARREGPEIGTIARLSPGVTLGQAQAELTVIGARLAAEFPRTNARLRPRIVPYLKPFTGDSLERSLRLGGNGLFVLLLVVICGNVGALVFARIATRERELIVRTALGASRARIVMQLFVEALVLTSTGAVVVLGILSWGLRRADALFWSAADVAPPFWRDPGLSSATILYVAALTVVGAVVTGILPALKFTRGGVQANLQRGAMGGSGLRSRRMSSALIVAQVALCGALLPVVMLLTLKVNWSDAVVPGLRAEEYLTVRYLMEESSGAPFDATFQKLKDRLLADGFASVTFTNQLPGSSNPGRLIEIDDAEQAGAASDVQRVRVATVDVGFFEALQAPILSGRAFQARDLASRDIVIVNQPFVQAVLGGRSAIGRRVRYTGREKHEAPGRWLEIVGVVPDLGMSPSEPEEAKGMYLPAAAGDMPSGFMAMRVGPNAGAAAHTFRSVAAAVDPTLLLYDVRALDTIRSSEMLMDRVVYVAVIVGVYFLVFLSAAVTCGLMSFTVAQRTREIGIRKALGAGPRAVLTSVFSRAAVQLGLGAGLGAAASVALASRIPDNPVSDPGMVLVIASFLFVVGFLASVAPAVRALRIEPTEAMRDV